LKQKHEPSFLYDVWSNAKARKYLKNLKKQGYTISPEQKSQSDAYAKEVLGSKKYAPWLYVFAAIQGDFKPGWFPHNYYRRYIATRKKGLYGDVSALGGLSPLLFETDAFPNVGYYINGAFFNRQRQILDHKAVANRLFSDCDEIVFKTDGSKQGNGIQFYSRKAFDPSNFTRKTNGVFQKKLRHHKDFDCFGSAATATIRVVTAVDANGTCTARVLQLRLGRRNDTHIRSKSQIKIHGDLVTGLLDETGFQNDFTLLNHHPDCGFRFGGFKIPKHKVAIDLVVKLHQSVPFAQTIGWDLVVDSESNLQILEWNGGHSGIHFYEAAKGPLFRDMHWEDEWKKA